jgi:hypothetical protein
MTPATADHPGTTMISPGDVQALADEETRAAVLFVEQNKVAVTDLFSCQRAVRVRVAIGEKQKEIVAKLEQPKSWAFKLHRWFCGLETAALAPYNVLDAYERDQIRTFNDEQARVREARERELAEQQRIAEQTRAAEEAAALESSGEPAMAAAVLEEAIAAPMPVVVLQNDVRAVAGAKFTPRYLWRFVNGPKEVEKTPPEVLARAMNLLPRDMCMPDIKKIGAFARAMKGTARVPGIEFYTVNDPVR